MAELDTQFLFFLVAFGIYRNIQGLQAEWVSPGSEHTRIRQRLMLSAAHSIPVSVVAMDIKKRPNHFVYIQALRRMSSEARLMKAFELTEFSREIFLHGLRRRFPDLTEGELHQMYLERLEKCHNRNY